MSNLNAIFLELRGLLAPYGERLAVKKDTATDYYVDTYHVQKNRSPLFFGAVQVKKAYVSYHLMPVYCQPALLASISPALKKRMQGKSCFNFAASDEALFRELATLTAAGYESFREEGFVP
jgi:hypothetical protein